MITAAMPATLSKIKYQLLINENQHKKIPDFRGFFLNPAVTKELR